MFSPLAVVCVVLLLVCEGQSLEPGASKALVSLRAAYPGAIGNVFKDQQGVLRARLRNGGEEILRYEKQRSHADRVAAPSLLDILHQSYPSNLDFEAWPKNLDPGRYRNDALLKEVYGDTKSEVEKGLVTIKFLDKSVRFQSRNGAAEALKEVGKEVAILLQTEPQLRKYFQEMGGTFNWRKIAGTKRLSSHSFGIAIDLNPSLGAYWKWERDQDRLGDMKHRLAYPGKIVRIFEKHGFIWGGKWYHYDLMHFEYRPEFFPSRKVPPSPKRGAD